MLRKPRILGALLLQPRLERIALADHLLDCRVAAPHLLPQRRFALLLLRMQLLQMTVVLHLLHV